MVSAVLAKGQRRYAVAAEAGERERVLGSSRYFGYLVAGVATGRFG